MRQLTFGGKHNAMKACHIIKETQHYQVSYFLLWFSLVKWNYRKIRFQREKGYGLGP